MREGTTVDDRFRITQRIAKGGMGTVYKGYDVAHDAPVALKVSHWSDRASIDRFLREADALARLHHPGVVRYVGHGLTTDRTPYVAMEWLEGEDLAQRLARGPLTHDETICVGEQVAEALETAHRLGVLHLDIKPSNLFLLGGDLRCIKLLDFGLAHVSDMDRAVMQSGGKALGTRGFIAPEQARGERPLDERADMYSLGAVLYSCLAERPPILLSHMIGSLTGLLFEVVPQVSEARGDVPAALDELISRLMAYDAGQRIATAGALLTELGQLGASAPGPRRIPAMCTHLYRRPRFWSAMALGSGELTPDNADLLTIARRHNGKVMPSGAEGVHATMYFTAHELATAVTAAACCASEMVTKHPGVALALATGRIQPGTPVPVTTVVAQASNHWRLSKPTQPHTEAADPNQSGPLPMKLSLGYSK